MACDRTFGLLVKVFKQRVSFQAIFRACVRHFAGTVLRMTPQQKQQDTSRSAMTLERLWKEWKSAARVVLIAGLSRGSVYGCTTYVQTQVAAFSDWSGQMLRAPMRSRARPRSKTASNRRRTKRSLRTNSPVIRSSRFPMPARVISWNCPIRFAVTW